ncbi:hypothetical protein SAMN06269250_1740 [Spirosoma fluviale]|uniref:Uncharacterized protein n=1 Tax=Spirosoma fluviale TaxID=1597977 RepID=A0A286FEN2_9BACT|nr:hypothetical protein SAMN06269250_1740 [Spirosoma fluviale]
MSVAVERSKGYGVCFIKKSKGIQDAIFVRITQNSRATFHNLHPFCFGPQNEETLTTNTEPV